MLSQSAVCCSGLAGEAQAAKRTYYSLILPTTNGGTFFGRRISQAKPLRFLSLSQHWVHHLLLWAGKMCLHQHQWQEANTQFNKDK